ncbi:MAG: sigma-54-dependent Fis family transcriptional regulator [Gracilimonas sp.]|uniref:sigma-54 interaction domain-containing protein n=1 Tax=Gracilimonas sp. TaxID=1974203 RepID=UPI0019C2FC44|nr:sigma-54 dependent transcriptional regulator [Gracilimonas sp.]MBD3615412.1 sigma-54-dependent Fis family transcriptional regulator [Gracilimonas sp.]
MQSDSKYHKESKDKIEPIFIAESPSMKELCSQINRIAKTEATVLLTGESGTGKEIVSRLIHHRSGRKERPFVALNCGAIPKDIVESELFGFEKGAFTGAFKQKEGCFELADNGTLFLDEIGEMCLDMQVKLLRAVEYKTFRRIGGKKEIKTDVRIIAATNRDMSDAMKNGEFRKDLFYRLSVIELHIPPLRERKEDIPALVNCFLNMFSKKYKCEGKKLSDESMQLLLEYNWPGNVRELRNTMERCVIMCQDSTIRPAYLTNDISGIKEYEGNQGASNNDLVNSTTRLDNGHQRYTMKENSYSNGHDFDYQKIENNGNGSYSQKELNIPVGASMQEAERILINKTLSMVDNNKSEAAKILGFSRQTLHNKLNKYNGQSSTS